jgi:predicted transcriptional regulator
MVKLFIPDWVLIICAIDDGINILTLSKKCNLTYKNTFDYVYLMKSMKLLTLKRVAYCQKISLTDKGYKLKLICCPIKEYC